MSGRLDTAELARSLLAEMPLWKRVEFLTGELLKINDLNELAHTHNLLKLHCDGLISEMFWSDDAANDQPNGGDAAWHQTKGAT